MRLFVACAAIALLSAPAEAAPKIDVHGLILGSEGARYVKGIPTLDLENRQGAAQIRFLGWDHSNAVFAVAFFNGGPAPVNIGLENLHASAEGNPVRLFTVDELTRQAKNRAMWSQIGLALLGGFAAASAANRQDTYHGTITSPYGGMYSFSGSYPSLAGQLQADRINANTAAGIVGIRYRLDATIEAIGDHILQTTTVDPGNTFGGLIVVEKLDYGKTPIDFRLDADWNGERYSFGYLLMKKGQPVPAKFAGMLAANTRPMARVDRATASGAGPAGAPVQQASASVSNGAIYLSSGAVKIPAKTPSGYCIKAPSGYMGAGSINAPAINKALPRCKDDVAE